MALTLSCIYPESLWQTLGAVPGVICAYGDTDRARHCFRVLLEQLKCLKDILTWTSKSGSSKALGFIFIIAWKYPIKKVDYVLNKFSAGHGADPVVWLFQSI